MNGPAERFGDAAPRLRDVEQSDSGTHLHQYTAVLDETDERVRVLTLAPELADAAVDAFSRVSGQWYNANTHPNIVPILDRDTTPRPWIAVPDDTGVPLVTIRADLTPEAIATVVGETAEALRTLGLYNAVHGHLSPDDIWIVAATDGEDQPMARVGGFGLEHAVRAAVGAAEPTPYTAPELLDDPTRQNQHTDVYGLGAVTYFALTGHPPVDGTNLEQALRDGPTAPPSDHEELISSPLDDVVMRALSAAPDDRQDSPYAFKRAFRNAFSPDQLPTPTDAADSASTAPDSADTADAPAEDADTQTERNVTRRTALGLLGLGIGVGGGGLYLSQREPGGTAPPAQTPTATLTPTPVPTAADTPTSTSVSLSTDTPTPGAGLNPTQGASLAANDGNAYANFGESVVVADDGTTALVGAPYDDGSGSVYVFDTDSGSWGQRAKLSPDDGDSDDQFGWSVALSADGTTALVGAYHDDDPNGTEAGSAYVFTADGDSWNQGAKLTADDGDSYDWFGYTVALSDDATTACVGAVSDEGAAAPNGGSAYVFDDGGGSWSQQTKLTPDDADSNDYFGRSVALSSDGTTALVGAIDDEDPNGEAAGSAYVFESDDVWSQGAKIAADDGDSSDWFGVSVALSSDGTTTLVGAYGDEDPNGARAGSAYVFDASSGSWDQQAKLAADDGDSFDWFGQSVALSDDGTTALVGAYSDEDPNGPEAGSAYVFDSSGGSWSQAAKLTADDGDSDDQFGWAVTLSGDGTTALVGARFDDDPNGPDAGAAYVYTL